MMFCDVTLSVYPHWTSLKNMQNKIFVVTQYNIDLGAGGWSE